MPASAFQDRCLQPLGHPSNLRPIYRILAPDWHAENSKSPARYDKTVGVHVPRPVVSGFASGLPRPDRTKEPNSSKGTDACDGTLPRQNGIQICCTKGLPMTPLEELTQANIAVLRAEADEARHLASALDDSASIVDLLKYAQALEADADLWERELRRAYE